MVLYGTSTSVGITLIDYIVNHYWSSEKLSTGSQDCAIPF